MLEKNKSKLGELVIDNIRYLRRKNGLTQKQLSVKAGIHHNHINNIERYVYYPGFIYIEKIAKALDIEPHKLFTELRDD